MRVVAVSALVAGFVAWGFLKLVAPEPYDASNVSKLNGVYLRPDSAPAVAPPAEKVPERARPARDREQERRQEVTLLRQRVVNVEQRLQRVACRKAMTSIRNGQAAATQVYALSVRAAEAALQWETEEVEDLLRQMTALSAQAEQLVRDVDRELGRC